MQRSISAAAMLAAVTLTGCGQRPAYAPAPAKQGPAAPPSGDAAQSAQPSDDRLDRGQLGDEPARLPADSLASEEMPAEEKAGMTDEPAGDEAPAAKTAAANDAIAGDDAKPAASQPRGSSGNLLRGLGNSLGRALSKAVTGGGDIAGRPAPKLEDDPFPDGEPKQ